jgi:hypothetical protein
MDLGKLCCRRARQRAQRAASLLTPTQGLTASAIAALIIDMRSWVHRRVESAQVIDDIAVIRRSSIDLTVPETLNDVDVGRALTAGGEGFIPITFLNKQRLRNFDLRDEQDRPLPMLSRRDNGELATNVLIPQAEAVLQRALPHEMRGSLRGVTGSLTSVPGRRFSRGNGTRRIRAIRNRRSGRRSRRGRASWILRPRWSQTSSSAR